MKQVDRKCRRKVRHAKRHNAIIALKSMEKKFFFLHQRKVYKCKYCGGWHIGRINKPHPKLDKQFKKLLAG